MVTKTRGALVNFKYICEALLDTGGNNSNLLAFFKQQQIDSSVLLLQLDTEQDLTYKDDQENEIKLGSGAITAIRNIQRWHEEQTLTVTVWEDVLSDEQFDTWSQLDYTKRLKAKKDAAEQAAVQAKIDKATLLAGTQTMPSTPGKSNSTHHKRNINDYDELKDPENFPLWFENTQVTSILHQTENILDSTYTPTTPDDIVLFAAANIFMCAVLMNKIKYQAGINIVREHRSDSQTSFALLKSDATEGQNGTYLFQKIETELKAMTLDESWGKSNKEFINAWQAKFLTLQSLQKPNDKITDSQKKRWLTASLSTNEHNINAINCAMQLEASMLGSVPGYKPSFDKWLNAITHSLVIRDQIDGKFKRAKTNAVDVKTNYVDTKNSSKSPRTEQSPNARMAAWIVKLKAVNMYLEPDKFRLLSTQEKKNHNQLAGDKIRAAENGTTVTTPAPTNTTTSITTPAPPSQISVASATTTTAGNAGSDLNRMLANVQVTPPPTQDLIINGRTYRSINMFQVNRKINVKNMMADKHRGSLIDNGANNGLSGDDVVVIGTCQRSADVTTPLGTKTGIPICTVAGHVTTIDGPAILIMHQYAHQGTGRTIHATNQVRSYGHTVDDLPRTIDTNTPGYAHLKSTCGYTIPFAFREGLAYFDMRKPTTEELHSLPKITLTSDEEWDPTKMDYEVDQSLFKGKPNEDFLPHLTTATIHKLHHTTAQVYTKDDQVDNNDMETLLDNIYAGSNNPMDPADINDIWVDFFENQTQSAKLLANLPENVSTEYVDHCLNTVKASVYQTHVKKEEYNPVKLQPNFGWVNIDRIQRTFENTTQYYRATTFNHMMKRHEKSRFPAANVPRTNEIVSMDTFFSKIPATDDGIPGHAGVTMAQIYTGRTSHHTAAYPMKDETGMTKTLEEYIRRHGAPTGLFSDNAKVALGQHVASVLRAYVIDDLQSEAYYQNQNPAERCIQDIKSMSNAVMSRTGTPVGYWLLCLLYVVDLMNHLSVKSLNNQTPQQAKTGQKCDISQFLQFRWWEPVYYRADDTDSTEHVGNWAGVAEHCGDRLTYKIVSQTTGMVVNRSDVRTATDPLKPNLRAELNIVPQKGEEGYDEATSNTIQSVCESKNMKPRTYDPDQLVGLTYLQKRDEGGQLIRAKIVRKLINDDLEQHQRIRYLVQIGEDKNGDAVDDIITYNDLCDAIEEQDALDTDDPDKLWKYKSIKAHQGPLSARDERYMGSKYNVLVAWEDGSESFQSLASVWKTDPVTIAEYAAKNGLLETPGWKAAKRIARKHKLFKRMINQAKLKSRRQGITYKYGLKVPRSYEDALLIDAESKNTKWQDSMQLELDQINSFDTFKDKGLGGIEELHKQGYQKIRLHWVFDIKHDKRFKSRFVANGAMTRSDIDGTYSSVVSLRSLRMCLTLAELNGLKTMVGDISNAYLTATTDELVYFIAGGEFGPLKGHTMVIYKAIYGLRTSGARFHDKLADTLRIMGFVPCKADQDVWMKDVGDCYEYICIYVDDVCASMKDPDKFFEDLTKVHKYKLSGVGPPDIHLGGNFHRDKDGILSWGAKKYIARVLETYKHEFGENPKPAICPIQHDAHPEIDDTKALDEDGIILYQSLIGSLQWLITLGRFDIMAAVMALSRFRPAPRVGHLEHVKQVFGYLRKYPDGALRFRTGIPNHEAYYKPLEYDWSSSLYQDPVEDIPINRPPPRGKLVRLTTYVDANLLHCLVTGRSATGIITLLNQTPIQWFSKRQNTVETATYGSEFSAARTASEQLIDLRYTLRMMGAPLDGPSWMFGDNKSVVDSSSIPSHTLNKRHLALSFHRVRECVASKLLYFIHIPGTENISDCLTKFLTHSVSWPMIKPILFWNGDTDDLNKKSILAPKYGE